MNRRVVITGMGVVSPGAENLASFEEMIRNGKSGIRFVPELEDLGFSCQVGGVAEFSAAQTGDYFTYFELDAASNFTQLSCVAGVEAWLDSGMEIPEPDSPEVFWDTGIIIGTGISGIDTIGDRIVKLTNAKRVARIGGLGVQNIMPSSASAYMAAILGLGNVAYSNSSACCTGTDAILESYFKIKLGFADRMLAGGADGYSPYCWAGFDALKVLNNKMNETPGQASRPMSESARGFVPGSGAGTVVLESLESALKRGAHIYAEVLGGAMNCGGQRNGGSMTMPNKEGVLRCIRQAVQSSGIRPEEIDTINGHLTATKADPVEIANWLEALDVDKSDFPLINGTKSMIGHCLGAAGAIETVATVLQLARGFVHPSVNSDDLHPEIADLIPAEKVPQTLIESNDIRIAAKASFGFGDVNSCLILKKWEE